jgi:hypothetical protein
MNTAVSLAELERCLGIAAYIVVRHGEAYAPTFERLEREVELERSKLDKRGRAQAVLTTMMRREVKDAPAARTRSCSTICACARASGRRRISA